MQDKNRGKKGDEGGEKKKTDSQTKSEKMQKE
jgi:hypothetical protein